LGGLWFYRARVQAPTIAAPIELVPETVPFIRDADRAVIRADYLPASNHKALAVSFSRMGFASGQPDDETAKTAAVENCKRVTSAAGSTYPCYLYAVANTVVFTGGNPPMPPSPWLIRNAAVETSFAGKNIPLASERAREFWQNRYPQAPSWKALALSPQGEGFYYQGGASEDEVIRRALESCGYTAGIPCLILAVGNSFVVPIPTTMKATGFFNPSSVAPVASNMQSVLARRFANAINAWNAVAVGANGRPGVMLNASSELDAIDVALADCRKEDRDCHVIALGPFTVEPTDPSK